MIRGALWLYGLWRALQRVQPAEGEPCFWCGRTNSTPPPIVGGDLNLTLPEGTDVQRRMAATNFELRRTKRPPSQAMIEETARRMGHALNRPDDDPPAPTGVPS